MALQVDEIKNFLQNYISSKKYRYAKQGQDYYEGKHDIRNYKMYYYNDAEELIEDTTRSNIKVSHPFQTELVDQLVQYMLSGDEAFLTSKDEKLQAILDEHFNNNDAFLAEFEDVLTGSAAKGFEYMYAYINKNGDLAFQCADSLKVVEVEGKYTSDGKDYVIYSYVERINNENKVVNKILVFSNDYIWYYTQVDNGEIKLDDSMKYNPIPNIQYKKSNDDTTYYEGLGFIPFFRIDYCKKQISSLAPIKELIDDYDLMACGLSNNLQDASEYLVVVSGFQGDSLEKIITNTKTKKVIGVDEGGEVDYKTVNIPYEARKVKLELDEKNIYRFGMGFNSAQMGDGNITNIVIKSRYALLDLKSNKFETRVRQFLKKIVGVVLDKINKEEGTGYDINDVKIKFKREVMTNASDNANIEKVEAETKNILINMLLTLRGIIDNETIYQKLCDVLDVEYEEIKDKLSLSPEDEIKKVEKVINDIVPDDEGDIVE